MTTTKELLSKKYTVSLSGGEIGYIIHMLADAQHHLNGKMEENIFDPNNASMAAANDIVGNSLLHSVYEAGGVDLLAFAMSTTREAMEGLMEARDEESLRKAADKIKNSMKSPKDKLN